jgi:hypothetical protein
MTVTSVHVAALRAALAGDGESFERLSASLGAEDQELPVLMATAFVAAAQWRFPLGWSGGDVVRFVGQLRARGEGAHEGLSATAAEQMLLSVLRGQPMDDQFDEVTKGYAQAALLAELVRDLNEQELGTFLAEARAYADAWLTHPR